MTFCSGYRHGEGICRHGFPQTAACHPQPCSGCGRYSDSTPHCMKDELPGHWLTEGGKPVFYQEKEERQ